MEVSGVDGNDHLNHHKKQRGAVGPARLWQHQAGLAHADLQQTPMDRRTASTTAWQPDFAV